MVLQKLLSIYENAKISQLYQNSAFGFSIYKLQPINEPFCLIYTDGLSKNTQGVSDLFSNFEHIELYFCLPGYWNLDQNPWPIEWLNRIGQIPEKNKTWFGSGDTIPAGNPPTSIADSFDANHFILSVPILLKKHLSGEHWDASPFQFLGVIPIFQLETNFKLRNSSTILINKLKDKNVSEMVDIYRSSVCRRRILGF